jgi:hypothetical protein
MVVAAHEWGRWCSRALPPLSLQSSCGREQSTSGFKGKSREDGSYQLRAYESSACACVCVCVRTKIKSEKITFSFRGFSPRERSCTSVPTLSLMLGSRMLDYWYVGDQDSVYRVSTLSGDPSLVLLYTPARSAVLRDVASATPAQPPTPWSHPLAHGQRPL